MLWTHKPLRISFEWTFVVVICKALLVFRASAVFIVQCLCRAVTDTACMSQAFLLQSNRGGGGGGQMTILNHTSMAALLIPKLDQLIVPQKGFFLFTTIQHGCVGIVC